MTTDPNLIKKYDVVYSDGEEKFWTFDSREEQAKILEVVDFKDKFVLEIGCGTGDMAAKIADAGAKFVHAIDPSEEAIKGALVKNSRENLRYRVSDLFSLDRQPYDVVVMIGVLEHVEDPAAFLDLIVTGFMGYGATLATSSPCFTNPRGYVWMALQTLFKIEMSLTDKHFLDPWFFWDYCLARNLIYDSVSVDLDWGNGRRLTEDFRRRLPAALKDVPPGRIVEFISWMEKAEGYCMGPGANMVYFIEKK